jgi:signal peptidase I
MRRPHRHIVALAAFGAAALALVLTFRVTVVSGDSMVPTFRDGQMVLANRLYALAGPLRTGDVVILRRGNDTLIKRVAYLPGQVVDAREAGRFAAVRDFFERPVGGKTPPASQPDALQVPAGCVVVLGDNPTVSDDSRAFGPVPLTDIIARVMGAPPAP